MGNLLDVCKKFLGLTADNKDLLKKPLWKKLNTMIIIAAAGILLIVLANAFSTGSGDIGSGNSGGSTDAGAADIQKETGSVRNVPPDINQMENMLAQELEQVLSQINGVGEIKVNVNLASTPQKDYAINTTTNNKTTKEVDQKGGNRTTTETNEDGQMVLVRQIQGSREEPVVVKEIKPEVKGVIIVAQGAADPVVKSDLMKAVQVYLDVPLYKVIVLPKESR